MGLVDGLIGSGLSVFGMIKGAQAGKRLQDAQEGVLSRQNSLADWYNNQSNKSFFDTQAAQSGLARIRDQYKNSLDHINSNGVQAGATTEAKVAAKSSLQDSYNKSLSNLVGYGTQYQNNMKRAYGGTLQGLYQGNYATYMPAVQSWGNLAGKGAQIAQNGFSSMDLGNRLTKSQKTTLEDAATFGGLAVM